MDETKIRAGSGASFQFHNVWYKLSYEEERVVSHSSEEELAEHRKNLWEKVNNEVDTHMVEITKTDSENNKEEN